MSKFLGNDNSFAIKENIYEENLNTHSNKKSII